MKLTPLAIRFNEFLWNFPKLHYQVHRAAAKLHPPPYLIPNTEVIHGATEAVGCARCEAGRALGESGAAPQYLRPKPPELSPAKFTGSREGHPINQVGFREALVYWRDALQILGVLRQEYMKRVGRTTAPLSYTDLFAICEIGMSLPAYMYRRADHRIADGELPSPIATVFKILAGLRKLAGEMITSGQSESPPHTAEQLWKFTEDEGLLISDFSNEVCPAADKLILKFIQVAINDEDHYELPDAISDVNLDLEPLMRYTMDCARLKLAFMISSNEIERAFLPVGRHLEPSIESKFTDQKILDQRIFVLNDALERSGGESFLGDVAAFDLDEELREMKIKEIGLSESLNQRDTLAALARTRYVLRCAKTYSSQLQQQMNESLGWETDVSITDANVWDRISGKANAAIDAIESEYFSPKGLLSLLT